MTDSSGAVVWSVTYDAFGKATVTVNAIENNLRFPGQYYDAETGYHYNGHRYYDPRTGRYVTADPIGLEGGVNLFSYSDVNPINKIDMSGLAATSNGCGPDDWRGQFVTDNPMGIINFKPACDKHDICYGECQKKELCDKRFCEQTKKLCSDKYSGRIFSFTLNDCNELAKIYCDAVTKKGKSAHDNACEKKKCADMKRIQVLED
jgi:RHS repeat-associated protein